MTDFRILDANLNRAREGLRVIEDYARFVANNASVVERCKEARNLLARVSEVFGSRRLLEARDTLADVGVDVRSEREALRRDAGDILAANFKRVQEALRVLEEYSKVVDGDLARDLEALRYGVYTAERDMARSHLVSRLAQYHVMMIVSQNLCKRPVDEVIDAACEAGVRLFQIREKANNDSELARRVEGSLKLIRQCQDALVIVNDRCDMARAFDADGVHLGQDDLSVEAAREVVGDLKLIGMSTHNIDEVKRAQSDGVDYIGAGAMYQTATKQVEHLGGPSFGVAATQQSSCPAYCIGGITLERARDLKAQGVERIAVSSLLCSAESSTSLRASAKELLELFADTTSLSPQQDPQVSP